MARYRVVKGLISLGGGRTAKRGQELSDRDLGSRAASWLRKGSVELIEEAEAETAAEAEAETAAEAEVDLDSMSVADLRHHAAEREIDLTGLHKKADIVGAIKAAG